MRTTVFNVVGEISPVHTLSPHHHGYKFSVTCRDRKGHGAFRPNGDPEVRAYVTQWCSENLSHSFTVAGYESVLFTDEEDAVLFLMAFK